ncbi:MAG: rane fusion protein heavy metal efflux system, partial [Acidobacteriaceae bacterium]|nr:rane fusion protein heavy metal efflux system [Acidobacteriaceae bacterium]
MNTKTVVRSRGQVERYRWIQSTQAIVMLASVLAIVSLTSGCRSSAASESNAQPNASTAAKTASDGAEIVLPVAEQQGAIATTTLAVQQEADVLRFPGKIVLPDNESWQVGVLTTGRIERVYANLGDYVHKGQ